jgi:uncharacterized protein YodC (DUF2158 family)
LGWPSGSEIDEIGKEGFAKMNESKLFAKLPSEDRLIPDAPIAYFINGEALAKVRGSLVIAKKEVNSPAADALIDAVEALVDALQGMASPLPNVGDLVVLKSGGPNMRIISVGHFGVHVEWDNEGTVDSAWFPFDCVTKGAN